MANREYRPSSPVSASADSSSHLRAALTTLVRVLAISAEDELGARNDVLGAVEGEPGGHIERPRRLRQELWAGSGAGVGGDEDAGAQLSEELVEIEQLHTARGGSRHRARRRRTSGVRAWERPAGHLFVVELPPALVGRHETGIDGDVDGHFTASGLGSPPTYPPG